MLDTVAQISSQEADLLVGRMKMTIAGAMLTSASCENVLNALHAIAGDSIDGPAVWGHNPTFEQAQAVLERWKANMTSAKETIASLAEILA